MERFVDLGVEVGRRTFQFKELFVDRRKEKFQLLGIGNISEVFTDLHVGRGKEWI